jgi:hypothetical protein
MTDYIVTLNDTEQKAMEFVAFDVNEWIQHAAHERARVAIDEIVQLAIQKFLEAGESIPGSKDDIVATAFDRGWIKTAAERNAEILMNMPQAVQ